MKALKIIVTGIVLFLVGTSQAQVAVSINLGSPPPWGPVGYSEVRYYYIPDVEAYYDIQASMFIYNEGGRWVHRTYLPRQYRNYDLYGGYKVVMRDYRGNAPYNNFADYRTRYPRGHRGEFQKTIRERPGKGNPREQMHSKGQPNNRENHGNVRNERQGNNKNVGRGNIKANPHSNNKNVKENKGHNEEKSRK